MKLKTIRNTILPCLLVLTLACGPATREEASDTTAVSTTPTAVDTTPLSGMLTFKDVNASEGNIALIFTTASGEERWFAAWDTGIHPEEFYTSTPRDGTPFPEVQANAEAVGKTFFLTWRSETTDDNPSGEPQEVLILVTASRQPG